MSLKTIEQERAKFAYDKISEIREKKEAPEYRPLVKGFGSMILQNGLGQSLAFLKAKKKEHHLTLYKHINDWLKTHLEKENDFDILKAIGKETSSDYRVYIKEALAFLVWLRKFAEAELPEK